MAGAASECGGRSVYGTDVDELPVDFTGCENVTCKLCGCKCTDITPLTSLAEVGTTTRWAQYGKVRDPTSGSVVAKKPKAKVDIICLNVYRALGLDDEYATLDEFYKSCCKPENAHTKKTDTSGR